MSNSMITIHRYLSAFLALSLSLVTLHATAAIDSSLLKGMSARAIGPAASSGRITDLEVVISNPNIIYAGAATGGLWKSINAGLNWQPIFDKQEFASIGAIAINQSSPDIIWVGTGEGNTRNSTSYGGGMFRSLDGGKTWRRLLYVDEKTGASDIKMDPNNPNKLYAAMWQFRRWPDRFESGGPP